MGMGGVSRRFAPSVEMQGLPMGNASGVSAPRFPGWGVPVAGAVAAPGQVQPGQHGVGARRETRRVPRGPARGRS